jgi:metalloendopeptidase OMA1, mitochondrial
MSRFFRACCANFPIARASIAALCGLVCSLTACFPARPPVPVGTVPLLQSVSVEDERHGEVVFQQLRKQYRVLEHPVANRRVRGIVDDLTAAAGAGQLPWRVYLFDDDSVINAAATRGNYIFVWSGMLLSVQDDAELATVLGHEIGHVLARHTDSDAREEASEILSQVSGQVASAVSQGVLGGASTIVGQVAEQLIRAAAVNPESRRKELEADHVGLFLMADAGFDPRGAAGFWSRAANSSSRGLGLPLEFLSTHPDSAERLKKIEDLLPLAMTRYRGDRRNQRVPTAHEFIVDPSPTAREVTSGDRWVVLDPEVPVFIRPTRRSEIFGTLREGTVVKVRSWYGAWVELAEPWPGFVVRDAITPARLR